MCSEIRTAIHQYTPITLKLAAASTLCVATHMIASTFVRTAVTRENALIYSTIFTCFSIEVACLFEKLRTEDHPDIHPYAKHGLLLGQALASTFIAWLGTPKNPKDDPQFTYPQALKLSGVAMALFFGLVGSAYYCTQRYTANHNVSVQPFLAQEVPAPELVLDLNSQNDLIVSHLREECTEMTEIAESETHITSTHYETV